jgi:hypothetical protein
MRTHQYHHLVDRYTRGDMNAVEQEEFRRLLENDPGLRNVLDSDRLISSAFRNDKAAIPADHTRLEQHLMSVLRGGPSASPVASPAAGGGVALGVKTMATIVAGIGIVAGSLWYLRSGQDSVAPQPIAPQQQLQPASPPAPGLPARDPSSGGTAGERTLPGYEARHAGGSDAGRNAVPGREERAGKPDAHSMNGSAVLSPDSVDVKLKLDRNKLGDPREN